MIETAELSIQRSLTATFVAADYVDLALLRTARVSNGAGGWRDGAQIPLASQRFRLIPSQDGASEQTTRDGRAVTPSYTLMGAHTVDMQRFDEFEVGGRRYQIVFINENRQYEVKGEVAYVG